MKTLLKGGTVVSAAGSRVADVLVDGEKIAAVGEGLAADGANVVDVSGKQLRVLLASVTYFKAKPGDQVSVNVPEDDSTTEWAALEAAL